jgi:hypothetical protein
VLPVVVALLDLLALIAPEPPATGWKVAARSDGIIAATAPSSFAAPWGSAEGIIDATPEEVLAHLIDFAALPKVVPRLAEVRVVRRDAGSAIVYFRIDLPWPIADRDYTARYRWGTLPDGSYRVAIDDANDLGPAPGKPIRVALVRGVWDLSRAPTGGTRARHVLLMELGGWLTRSVVEQTAWKQPLESIRGVRRALAPRR